MEILVRVKNKTGRGPKGLKRNNVVTVQKDGHPWTVLERTNPEWRILKADGNDPDVMDALTEEGVTNARKNRYRPTQANIRETNYMNDDGRQTDILDIDDVYRLFNLVEPS